LTLAAQAGSGPGFHYTKISNTEQGILNDKENKTSKFSIRNSIFVIQIRKYLIGFPAPAPLTTIRHLPKEKRAGNGK
jgi:hypothetical protein